MKPNLRIKPSISELQRWSIAAVLLLMSAITWAQGMGHSQYKLGSGDVITIRVFGEEDLSFDQLRLTDAGTLSYPFLGEVHAAGRTAAQLEQAIIEGLKGDYLIDPNVSISVLEYRAIFINGEVRSPGGYPYQPGLTVRAAVALAGGLTERASERRIQVIREANTDREPESAAMDTSISPGDIITIDQSFF